MTRSDQESPVPEIGTPGSRWRGLETAYGKPIRARSWKRRIQPRGAYGVPRQSSTRPLGPDPICWAIQDGIFSKAAAEEMINERGHACTHLPGANRDQRPAQASAAAAGVSA